MTVGERSGPVAGSPSVSVIIPTYQRRDYVIRAVGSVLAQTFNDFELIVVDDGSVDGTGEALAGLDPRFRYHWQPNGGAAAARNTGIRLARGEIVAFLDSDDRWLPHHLQVVVEALALHPEAVLVCTCPGLHVAGRQSVQRARVVDALPWMLGSLGRLGWTPCIAVRRRALVDVGGFDERLVVAEDNHLWIRLAGRGPFCLLSRRSIVRQKTDGSLIDRGIRSGEYPKSFELIAEAGMAEAVRRSREGRGELTARAHGACQYAGGLRALARSDDEAARLALSAACECLPELSSQPEQVAHRISRISWGRAVSMQRLASAAALWPDVRADTALFLRAKAIVLSVRTMQFREAVTLVAGWPLSATPGFVLRNLPLWARIARRMVQASLYRGREAAALTTAPRARAGEGESRAAPREGDELGLRSSE